MAKWVHAQRLGHTITDSSRILATGGASGNTAILQAGPLSTQLPVDDGPHRLLLISSMLMCMCKRRQPTRLALELPTEPNTVGDCLHVSGE